MPHVLEVEDLSVQFGRTVVLRDLTFAVSPGDSLAVIGLNGSGALSGGQFQRVLLAFALVGNPNVRKAFDVDFLMDEGVIDPEDRELFWFAEAAQEIWDGIVRWQRPQRGAGDVRSLGDGLA